MTISTGKANALLVLSYMQEAEQRREIFRKKLEKDQAVNLAWINLNNLYLSVERGQTKMTIHVRNKLECLLAEAYDLSDSGNDPIIRHWQNEFQKLPQWNEV